MLAWLGILKANEPYFVALVGLAALDLVLGASRALAAKRFRSDMLRQTLLKFVEEIALPMMLAFLGLANHVFDSFVTAAIWVGIVAEATSLIEQLRGKSSGGLWGEILKVLKDIKGTSLSSLTGSASSPSNSTTTTTPKQGG